MTRKIEVLAYLKKQGKAGGTVQEAMRTLYINDFRKAVSDLRDGGVTITDVWEKTTGARYKRYFYKGEK